MIPLVRNIIRALLFDEMAVRRWLRGAMVSCAVGGVAFADQLAGAVGAPKLVTAIKAVSFFCAFIGGATSVGERNPRPTGGRVINEVALSDVTAEEFRNFMRRPPGSP